MKFVAKIYPLLLAWLLVQLGVPTVMAQRISIIIDGNFDDWIGKVSAVDSGGPDDESKPSRADISEFRADADSKGLYLLKTWDDTSFGGGQATTAGITLQTVGGAYYRIYSTAQDTPGSVPLSSLSIARCNDATCAKQKEVCSGTGCSNALAGSGTTWQDPFADIRKKAPDCSGEECGMYDTAVELYIPWDLVGGVPGIGETIFLNFGSYPSGPAQAPKDDTVYGIACQNLKDAWKCFLSKPTAVTLASFHARTESNNVLVVGMAMLVLSVAGLAVGWYTQTRAR